MSGNLLVLFFLLVVWPAAERSGGSPPGEPHRSAAAAKAGADSGAASRPDPGVVAKAKRRTYTAEYISPSTRTELALLASSCCPESIIVFHAYSTRTAPFRASAEVLANHTHC
jgi:hypothetical protein